ncbi:protease Lon-related BREX system protein BrxL [Clostridium perfringens]|uniref:protease Lon-related BREX system protein BrxL n=1 Tax=Clostridium perfringens TaxID=1502 RepID=UPI000DA39C21|nr:protease Lon-related BREX system protein BrxL [Clostridium perfringens]MCX0364081.1 protease Lon-related BREX system protein BrxL [Clostridium perfringens]MDH2462143.1 protease Lon-related BREX system protein BrxL [Clostridium perfringens]MDK0811845.1 protease Lon-related BREX system protein BrxL [Clostridium perfringens]MDK0882110.1 protease Lon-related BREX system protein BrxL [Clostridium perfringens]MDK0902076.1 protease Lon-related BREX system protein BrxL [Clostridium perfringens]
MEEILEFDLDKKVNKYFGGRAVRKDLTKTMKQGFNVPVYVLEYLLGMYCATDDEDTLNDGIERVKSILSDNYVRPDEAEKIKSKIRELGQYSVIDKITVKLNEKKDLYEAEFSNLGLKGVPIAPYYVKEYDKLLQGGIWCILKMDYYFDEEVKNASPFNISNLKPIQMPNMDIEEIFDGRKNFSKDEWIDLIIRSTGMEPTNLEENVKWHTLLRLVPLVENNYNLCELGPRGTGKSHVYKEISPNSILVSGGQTTVANLFYNMSQRKIGLVGMWDTVAFDEVAGIRFKDKDGIQIMKDYMASGSFARGKEEKNASASMVFVGNINQSIESLIKTSHLFAPFPPEMANDSAFFDRIHYYLPGWEIPKMRTELLTDRYGLIVDYLSEFFREMRKRTYTDAVEKYFILGNNLNQRDAIAVRKTVSGLIKIIYPNGEFEKQDVEEILKYALIGRRRVKEQLKKIGGMEFYDVHFSYIDKETMNEEFVSVPEQGGGKLIPEGLGKPGHVYTVGHGDSGMIGIYKIENQVVSGSGKFEKSGVGTNRGAKESLDTAFRYFTSNSKSISSIITHKTKDYLMHISDTQGIGITSELAIAELIGLASASLERPIQESLVVIGNMTVGGTINKVEDFANIVQVCVDAGARKILIPASSVADLYTVPADLLIKIQPIFYSDPIDSVYKALGVN